MQIKTTVITSVVFSLTFPCPFRSVISFIIRFPLWKRLFSMLSSVAWVDFNSVFTPGTQPDRHTPSKASLCAGHIVEWEPDTHEKNVPTASSKGKPLSSPRSTRQTFGFPLCSVKWCSVIRTSTHRQNRRDWQQGKQGAAGECMPWEKSRENSLVPWLRR